MALIKSCTLYLDIPLAENAGSVDRGLFQVAIMLQ